MSSALKAIVLKQSALCLLLLILFSTESFSQNLSDSYQLDDFTISLMKARANGTNFQTCDANLILSFFSPETKMGISYRSSDEFGKRRVLSNMRDSLSSWTDASKEFIYSYVSTRLIGEYDFQRKQFPVIGWVYEKRGGDLPYTAYKNDAIVLEHTIPGVRLANADKFPLYLKFEEGEAEKILNKKKELNNAALASMTEEKRNFMSRYQRYRDVYGNYSNDGDRRVYFIYLLMFLPPSKVEKATKTFKTIVRSLNEPSGYARLDEDNTAPKAEILKVWVVLYHDDNHNGFSLYTFYPDKQIKDVNDWENHVQIQTPIK